MRSFRVICCAALLTCFGCAEPLGEPDENDLSSPPTGLVFGGPFSDPKLEPFQGLWQFVSREFDPAEASPISGGPDIQITGHVIRFQCDLPAPEIRLCQILETTSGISAEGWHHEDIGDPGDMQRVQCSAIIDEGKLVLRWRMVSDSGFSDDPVIAPTGYQPPAVSAAEALTPWWIETYSRASEK